MPTHTSPLRPAALLLPLLVLPLVGCLGSAYRRPELAMPKQYRDGEAGAHPDGPMAPGARSLGELKWSELIHDDELAKLIQEAQANNYDVRIAAARVLQARAQWVGTRAGQFPAVNGTASLTNMNMAQNGSGPVPEGVSTESHWTDLTFSLGWEIDLWGRLRNASAAARAELFASEEARRTVMATLVSDVADAYFLLRDLDQELVITRRDMALREASLELVQLRVENGYSSEIDRLEAEVLVKSAQTELTNLELQVDQTENQISELVGRNPGTITRGRSILEQELPARLPAGLPSSLLEQRPDVREAEDQLAASHALVAVARAAYFPTLALTSTTGFESGALRHLFEIPNGTWLFAPAASLPIFSAGRVRAGVRSAQASREQALLSYQQTVQRAFREVADGLVGARKLSELRTQQESLVDSLQQSVEIADQRYRGGVASYLEFIESERQLLDAELQLVQVRRQEITNVVTIYRALGGGWQ